MELRDKFNRRIDYLRLSVTDHCNLRCVYCMPSGAPACEGREKEPRAEVIERLIRVALDHGLIKVRFTGGEPLMREDLAGLVAMTKRLGVSDVSLTTNGLLLPARIGELRSAGLDRLNFSLDSLRPETYSNITGGGSIDRVYDAIALAGHEGFAPIKINVVPIRGINSDELIAFASLTLTKPYHVRFIELMSFDRCGRGYDRRIESSAVMAEISRHLGPLTPMGQEGSSRNFRLDGAAGVLGFISPMSNHFCGQCNRLRLTVRRTLRPCLFSDKELSIDGLSSDTEMEDVLMQAVACKPMGRTERDNIPLKAMSQIGG